jgi:hypothetical protein
MVREGASERVCKCLERVRGLRKCLCKCRERVRGGEKVGVLRGLETERESVCVCLSVGFKQMARLHQCVMLSLVVLGNRQHLKGDKKGKALHCRSSSISSAEGVIEGD